MKTRSSYDRLWRKRLDALEAVWPEFLAGHTVALHKVRVASRRIREALPVVGAAAPADKIKKLRRKLRDLTRHLGPVRELDVELGLLEKAAADGRISRQTLATLRRELGLQRHALRDRLSDEPPVADLKKLLRKLERMAAPKDRKPTAALAATLLHRAKKMKGALAEAGPLYAPERIHEVRIATKKLRYALEIADEKGQADARALVKVLKKEQERLGYLHDLQVLLRHVHEAESSVRVGSRMGELSAYAEGLERDCRQLHAQFVEDRTALFECLAQVRRHLVPALTTESFHLARVTKPVRHPHARMARAK